jgi:hypothetical protein
LLRPIYIESGAATRSAEAGDGPKLLKSKLAIKANFYAASVGNLNRSGFAGDWSFELRRHGYFLWQSVIEFFGFGWRCCQWAPHPAMVEPVDPFERGELAVN